MMLLLSLNSLLFHYSIGFCYSYEAPDIYIFSAVNLKSNVNAKISLVN